MDYDSFYKNVMKTAQPNTDIFAFTFDESGRPMTKYSSHKIMIDGNPVFFFLANNKWIYLYTLEDMMSIVHGGQQVIGYNGSHYTFGYSQECNNLKDTLLFHQTRYFQRTPSSGYKVSKNCNMKFTDLPNIDNNPPCQLVKRTCETGPMMKNLQFLFSQDNANDFRVISNFVKQGLVKAGGGKRGRPKKQRGGGYNEDELTDFVCEQVKSRVQKPWKVGFAVVNTRKNIYEAFLESEPLNFGIEEYDISEYNLVSGSLTGQVAKSSSSTPTTPRGLLTAH